LSSATRLGFWSAVLTAIFAAAAFVVGVASPVRSGPFCASACITYPYTNGGAAFVPIDYIWMYPGVLLAMIFVVLMACIHYYASDDKKVFSQIGLSFALIYSVVILVDYFIQLAVMQPSFLNGETVGLSLFSIGNPHGIFIGLEDIGYLMMSVAFLFIAAVFAGRERLERSLRWLLAGSSVVAIGSLIVLSLVYGYNLEYRFEVTVLTINWITLIVSGALLSLLFKRAAESSNRR